jgi:hypothetical protein
MVASPVRPTCDFRDDVAYLSLAGNGGDLLRPSSVELAIVRRSIDLDVDEVANRLLGFDSGHHARVLFGWVYERCDRGRWRVSQCENVVVCRVVG